ncbi:transmembrane protein, putative (macronuclear) [Tetrahymena thermophila SB210]|uniref:Transmembrane protein, putative n=1 Tax=Tetrahymena thermophila (strain SB210) TaxID=312017 RepID=Q23YX4_TETTS|nr:transmembrane protein, putative [Tetrahymena thermophila SB210]EAS01681.2 transmembrane protein, putative [Tetrahymena thermophila SB210]|eukprot:XP_001021926.2 transmembrane protein, putative [Tetrahymena thermophila SB210]
MLKKIKKSNLLISQQFLDNNKQLQEMSEVEKMHYVPNEVLRIESILSKQMSSTAKSKFQKLKNKNQRKEITVYPPKWNNGEISAYYLFMITVPQIIIISLWASGIFIEYHYMGLTFTIFVYLSYLIESFRCNTFKQLFNAREQDSFFKDLKNYKEGKPEICLDIKCYSNMDKYGSKTNYTYMEQVKFDYDSYVDKSSSFPNVFDSYSIVRVQNILTFSYNDQLSEYYFESKRRNALHRCFIESNCVKQFNNSKVHGQVCHMIIKQNTASNFFYSWITYSIFTIVGLNIVYRLILNTHSPFVQNYIHKVIQAKINHKKLLDDQLKQADFLNENKKIAQEEYEEIKQYYDKYYQQNESFLNVNYQTPELSSQGSKQTQPSEVLKFNNQNHLSKNDAEVFL